jgi:hypothetical protein
VGARGISLDKRQLTGAMRAQSGLRFVELLSITLGIRSIDSVEQRPD